MTTSETTRKPDPQGDDQTQPSQSPGEIQGGDDDTIPTRARNGGKNPTPGQRGVTTPRQPGRKDRQDPTEYPGGSLEDEGQGTDDDDDLPPPDPQRST